MTTSNKIQQLTKASDFNFALTTYPQINLFKSTQQDLNRTLHNIRSLKCNYKRTHNPKYPQILNDEQLIIQAIKVRFPSSKPKAATQLNKDDIRALNLTQTKKHINTIASTKTRTPQNLYPDKYKKLDQIDQYLKHHYQYLLSLHKPIIEDI